MTTIHSRMRMGRLSRALGAVTLALGVVALTPVLTAAAKGGHLAHKGPHVCTGTLKSPGVLSGHYFSAVVEGVCFVNAGPAVVGRNLTIQTGGALIAAFALNDRTHNGTSSLTVHGSVQVNKGGAMLLGCDPQSSPCNDDNKNNPTLSSPGVIGGNLSEDRALGVIVHNSSIGGNLSQERGGGGFNCNPSGIFAAFKSPVFSTYEDSSVGGNVSVDNVRSCWFGLARLHVGGNVSLKNDQLADPDAIEVLANTIGGNLGCHHDSAVWDNAETGNGVFPRTPPQTNTVGGHRSGQCVLASPAAQGGSPGPGIF